MAHAITVGRRSTADYNESPEQGPTLSPWEEEARMTAESQQDLIAVGERSTIDSEESSSDKG